jgi:hypothetical protein
VVSRIELKSASNQVPWTRTDEQNGFASPPKAIASFRECIVCFSTKQKHSTEGDMLRLGMQSRHWHLSASGEDRREPFTVVLAIYGMKCPQIQGGGVRFSQEEVAE